MSFPFKEDGTVMLIVNLVLQLDEAKKRIKKLEVDKECLNALLQRKQNFEVRA